MRLLTNMGNSDLRVMDSQGNELVFRQKREYKRRIEALCEAIENQNCIALDTEGNLQVPICMIDPLDNTEKWIVSIQCDILRQEILQLEIALDKRISSVVIFVTCQLDSGFPDQDTFVLYQLLSGPYGKAVFPGIRFSQIMITCDPSDYGAVYGEYATKLDDFDFSDCVVAIAQGTPAMCYALSCCSLRKELGVPQFYAAHVNDGVVLKPLVLFSRQEKQRILNHYLNLMERGDYSAALEVCGTGVMSRIPGIMSFTQYLFDRSSYKFGEAVKDCEGLKKENPDLYSRIRGSLIGLEDMPRCISNTGRSNLRYGEKVIPYMLYETLQNIRFYYDIENYFLAIGLFTSFLDILQAVLIAYALDVPDLEFNGKASSYQALDDYIEEKLLPYKTEMGKCYKDLWKNWNMDENGHGHLRNTGIAMAAMLKYFANSTSISISVSALLKKYMSLQSSQGQFQEIRQLRNILPIAHSVKGVDVQHIDASFKCATFCEILVKFEEIVWAINPSLEKSMPYRLMHNDVRELFRRQIDL